MILSRLCETIWRRTETSDAHDDPCIGKDLYGLVRGYKTGSLSERESKLLFTCVLCKISKIRKLWRRMASKLSFEIRSFYHGRDQMMESALNQSMRCGTALLVQRVKRCLTRFDLDRLNGQDDEDVLRLISKYVGQSIHYRQILQDLGMENLKAQIGNPESQDIQIDQFRTHDPDPEEILIWKDIYEKVVIEGRALDKAKSRLQLADFLHETKLRVQPRSARARQQKKRLKDFLQKTWKLDNQSAAFVVEMLEYSIQTDQPPDDPKDSPHLL